MLENYLPVLIFCIIGILFGLTPIIMSKLIAPDKPSEAKSSAYECGFPPFSQTRDSFAVRYYLIAILFIIFDLEIAFLFPWAVVFKKLGWEATIAVFIFLAFLIVGFIYEWKKGALDWQ